MTELKFAGGLISARAPESLKPDSNILIGIPGGPGIPGHYLDPYISKVAAQMKIGFLVIDLPNHRASDRSEIESYLEAKKILLRFLTELSELNLRAHLVGHSLGAIIALDLLMSRSMNFAESMLVSMPVELGPNKAFREFCVTIGAPSQEWKHELDFERLLRAVLPGYFYRAPLPEEFDLLATRTSWVRNAGFTLGMPNAETLAKNGPRDILDLITYVEGTKELVLPPDNFQRAQSLFPHAIRLSACGHFPMLECEKELIAASVTHLNSPKD